MLIEGGAADALIKVHQSLEASGLPHAFGGAFALQWCTGEPRGTVDVDVNVLVELAAVDEVVNALPTGIEQPAGSIAQLQRDGQSRLYLHDTPIDLFLNTTSFHGGLANRVQHHQLFGTELPFLNCDDLCVFKAFFNRRKDWADIEAMLSFGSVDVHYVVGVLEAHLGGNDERIATLREVEAEVR